MISQTEELVPKQLSARLSCSLKTTYRMLRRGDFEGAYRVGRDWRIPLESLRRFMENGGTKKD